MMARLPAPQSPQFSAVLYFSHGRRNSFRHIGSNVKVYKLAIILSPENVTLGSDIIIDDFVFLGAHRRLVLGNRVHISSPIPPLPAAGRVLLSDFSGMGSGVRLCRAPTISRTAVSTDPPFPRSSAKRIGAP